MRVVNVRLTKSVFQPVTAAQGQWLRPKVVRRTIGADDRVDRDQVVAVVVGVAALVGVEFEAEPGGLLAEDLAVVRGGQALEERLHRRRKAIVGLVGLRTSARVQATIADGPRRTWCRRRTRGRRSSAAA